jgi:hypothetical protein
MVKKALLIGIDYVDDPMIQLNNCIQNIVYIKETLINVYGYEEKDIIELTNDSSNELFLPTKSNIINNLISVVSESRDLDEIWFYYYGYSSQIVKYGVEINGLEDIIVPCDFRSNGFIEDIYIFQLIRNVKCRFMLIFDCYYSNRICSLQWNIDYMNGLFVKTMNPNKYTTNNDIVCFSGFNSTEEMIPYVQDSENNLLQENIDNVVHDGVKGFTSIFLDCLCSLEYDTDVLELFKKLRNYSALNNITCKPLLSSSNITPNFVLTKYTKQSISQKKIELLVERDIQFIPYVLDQRRIQMGQSPNEFFLGNTDNFSTRTVPVPIEKFNGINNLIVEKSQDIIDTKPTVLPSTVSTVPTVPINVQNIKIKPPMAFTKNPSTIPFYYQRLSIISKNNTNPLFHIALKKK